jgi:lipopolysaccharide biosynthesis glycosyltransferase
LLFNLKAIRENNLTDEFFSCQQTHQSIIQFQDQDVINMVMKGRIKLMPSLFNWTSCDCRKNNKKLHDPIIVHYTGSAKPWSCQNHCAHIYKNDYYKYLLRTPYANYRHYYRMFQWYCRIRDFIFYMKTNRTAFRIKIFGIQIYKKRKKISHS